jgi:hypothetical protein
VCLQKEELATFAKDSLPEFLKTYEQFSVNNGTGWLVGKKVRDKDAIFILKSIIWLQVTWADLLIGEYLSRLNEPDWLPGLVDSYPRLKALMENVYTLPNIKAWVAKRPQTGF